MSQQNQKNEGINAQLALVIKSGKYDLGLKKTLKAIRNGDCKAVILSSNLPVVQKTMIEYLSLISKSQVILYAGNNIDLGVACGKLFKVSCLSINDAGDSDILNAKK